MLVSMRLKHDEFNTAYKIFCELPDEGQKVLMQGLLFGYISGDEAFSALEAMRDIESPIEKIFYIAFLCKRFKDREESVFLMPQFPIQCGDKKYIADFVFTTDAYGINETAEHDFSLVIECDGYEYHNATKEQVSHDNERDYDLKMEGYEVLHFSGSQIVSCPLKCATQAINYIKSKIGKVSRIESMNV